MNNEFREAEMSIEQLDQVSGGDMLGIAINAAEKYGRFVRPFDQRRAPAGDDPVAQISLHMR